MYDQSFGGLLLLLAVLENPKHYVFTMSATEKIIYLHMYFWQPRLSEDFEYVCGLKIVFLFVPLDLKGFNSVP